MDRIFLMLAAVCWVAAILQIFLRRGHGNSRVILFTLGMASLGFLIASAMFAHA